MAKRKRTYEPRMKLEMSFSEAVERFIGTRPQEMHANVKRAKKKKPPGEKSSGGKVDHKNVVKLRSRRMSKRNG